MQLVATLLATCACAFTAAQLEFRTPSLAYRVGNETRVLDPIPNYVQALQLIRRNVEALQSYLPHEELRVTDPRRHYVIITGVLAVVVEYLNSDCSPPDYEHQYLPAVDRFLPFVWNNPGLAVEKLDKFIKDTNETVVKIQEIVDYYCKTVRPNICNAIILAVSDNREDYLAALDLLINLGQLSAMYEADRFEKEAKQFEEVSLLLKGKEKLKPLVLKAAEVYYLLYGKRCFLK